MGKYLVRVKGETKFNEFLNTFDCDYAAEAAEFFAQEIFEGESEDLIVEVKLINSTKIKTFKVQAEATVVFRAIQLLEGAND